MCVVGMREDVEDLIDNLRQIIFRRKRPYNKKRGPRGDPKIGGPPEKGTFDNPWVGSLSVKGPIAAVAGDIVLPDELEVVNKSAYLCTMNANYYLNLQIKIEEIEEYVLPEFGYDSLNRDIDAEGFFYIASYCCPVQLFGFEAQRVPEALSSAVSSHAHKHAIRYYKETPYAQAQKARFGRDPHTDPVYTTLSSCLQKGGGPHNKQGGPQGPPKGPPQGLQHQQETRSSNALNTHIQSATTKNSVRRLGVGGAPTLLRKGAPGGGSDAGDEGGDEGAPPFPYESLGEIVTIEIHTDGSATPREAFIEALERVEGLALETLGALRTNCKPSRDGNVEEEFEDPDMYQDKHRQATCSSSSSSNCSSKCSSSSNSSKCSSKQHTSKQIDKQTNRQTNTNKQYACRFRCLITLRRMQAQTQTQTETAKTKRRHFTNTLRVPSSFPLRSVAVKQGGQRQSPCCSLLSLLLLSLSGCLRMHASVLGLAVG